MNIQEFKDSIKNCTFHDAIKLDGNGDAYIDMVDARTMWMNNLRRHRSRKLALLDIDSLRALENKDDVALAAVLAKKQELRDMPQTYDLSQCEDWKVLLTMFPPYVL